MRHRTIYFLVMLLVVVPLLLVDTKSVSAQSYVTVVTQPGDTLSKIARQYCTTWQEIYDMNRQTIGPNPNYLAPGLVLTVPNRCGGSGGGGTPPSGVYDRGPRTGATGTFSAPYYTVAWGDNLQDIARRFGTTPDAIIQANDMWGPTLTPGMILFIPGTGSNNTPPPPTPAPGTERVSFSPGSVSATRIGTTSWNSPKSYVLTAHAGQQMEIYTKSHGEPLAISVTAPNGSPLLLGGVNYSLQNNVWATLPSSGDFVITVKPTVMPESPTLTFDITFVIR